MWEANGPDRKPLAVASAASLMDEVSWVDSAVFEANDAVLPILLLVLQKE